MGFFGQAIFDIDRPLARQFARETASVITAGMAAAAARETTS
jgi:hypothetical protein